MVPERPPIRADAPKATPENAATLIFLHGYADDGDGWTNIAEQFHSAGRVTHLSFIFPNAPMDQESMATSWFALDGFSVRDEDVIWKTPYDEEGMLASTDYVCGLIDAEIEQGIPPSRIVVGGFSQGAAIAFLVGLGSRYAGKLAGLIGLSGSMPPMSTIEKARELVNASETNKPKDPQGVKSPNSMRIFIAHGTKDQSIPLKAFTSSVKSIERSWWGASEGKGKVETHVYEGLGHQTFGRELTDIWKSLERVVPA